MQVEDLFRLAELDDVAVSPDGNWVAATITRPGVANPCPTCNYKATGDVWLLAVSTGEWRNVTNGGADDSSAWSPVWSPDSKRLAFVSTRTTAACPARDIRLHVLDLARSTTTLLAERGIWLQAEFRAPARAPGPFLWLDDTTLLAAVLPPGTSAIESMLYWRRGVGESTRAWASWSRGEVTASVLDSGAPAPPLPLPVTDVQRLDCGDRSARTVATLPQWDLWDLRQRLQVAVAPDFARAAFVAVSGTVSPRANAAITDAIRTFVAGTFSLAEPAATAMARLDDEHAHVDGELLDWSPDASAFVLREAASPDSSVGRFVRVLANGEARALSLPRATIDRVVWTRDARLVARAITEATSSAPARADWWRLDGDDAPRNLTAGLAHCPDNLVAARDANHLLGLADGNLWCIDSGDGAARSLASLAAVSSLRLLPDATDRGGTSLLAAGRSADGPVLTHVTVPAAATAPDVASVTSPSATSTLVAGDPRRGPLVFRDDTATGTVLWTTARDGAMASRSLVLNAHVAAIQEGARSLIDYTSSDGRALHGVVIVPPGYEPGRRCPAVVWVYGGLIVRDTTLAIAGKSSTRPLNLELLVGHGYAVIVPSVPLPAADAHGDPLLEIPKGVMPCVDAVIAAGIADPDRLAVMGHSTGGYTTYAIVTQTTRFRAAVALSGHPDLISLHTQFVPSERTSPRAHEGLATASFAEDAPLYLGGPPWTDWERYVRNSPLRWFDRVTTPLLIVHGDMDGAPIQQGEEAFSALYRLGRRARFVRYWGEGHVVGSPANVRHLWSQIFDWLDTHLGGPPNTSK
jgi:dipeptidyl aminopeptidase/acylaminoacyl peptidase